MPRFWRNFLIFLALGLIGFGAYLYWNRATLQRRLIREAIARIQPGFPMRIEEVEVDSSWSHLSFHLRQGDWDLGFSGALDFHSSWTGSDLLEVHYAPELVVTHGRDRFEKLPLDLRTKIAQDFSRASELRLESAPSEWSHAGIHFKAPHLVLDWQGGVAKVSFDASSLEYRDEVSVPGVSMRGTLWPTLSLDVQAQETEALLGDTYLDLPLQKLPLHLETKLDPSDLAHPKSVGLSLPRLQLTLRPGAHNRILSAHWKATDLNIPTLARELVKSSPFAALSGYEFKKGTIESEGDLTLDLRGKPQYAIRGRVRAIGVALRAPGLQAAARGVELDLPLELDSRTGHMASQGASLAIVRFGFRGFRGSLARTRILYDSPKLEIAKPGLTIDGIPLQLGAIQGSLKGASFELQTSLDLAATPIEPLIRQACVNHRVPTSQLELHFSRLKLANGTIDPTGAVTVHAFGGQATLKGIGLYELDSEVPEVFLDADWSGFQLAQIGRYLHIGKMGGTVEGHAHDVLVQGWLPTQFDFKMQALPLKTHKWDSDGIVMSPHSLLNLIKILTGEKLKLPGILRSLYFGKLYALTGGYDLRYAGISLFSRNGSILLQTLDPPDVLQTENGKHFVLYGRRVKMPIRSSKYPVVLDSTALGNFIRKLSSNAEQVLKTKDAEGEDLEPQEIRNDSPQLTCPAPQIDEL
jgi:hypothetical protein